MRLITLIKIGNEECFITTNYNESDAIDSFGCHIHHGLHSPGELRNGASVLLLLFALVGSIFSQLLR